MAAETAAAHKKTFRLNLEFPVESMKPLIALRERLGESTMEPVALRAFELFAGCVTAQAKGGTIVLRNPDGTEVVLEIF